MTEDRHPVTGTGRGALKRPSFRRITTSRVLRNVLLGVAIGLVLTCIEGVVWIFYSHSLSAPLALLVHASLFWLIPVVQVIGAIALVQVTDRPLALYRYIRDVQKAQERYRIRYTPLVAWSNPYETTITYYQDTPDPSIPVQAREMSMRDLAQQGDPSLADTQPHQLILGAPGAGKTMALYVYQYAALQERKALVFGRGKIPVFVPLRNYSLFLKGRDASHELPEAGTLLDFLYTSDLPGMHHLRPHLYSLAEQGRLLLLCDGLNEVDAAYEAPIIAELADRMSQDRNRLLVTCREVDSRRQPQLALAVEENLLARLVIHPLEHEQVRGFVERYIEEEDSGSRWRHTAGQVMEVIDHSRLREHCVNPLMLFALLEIIDSTGVQRGKQLDTRGRLLQAYASYLMRYESGKSEWSGAAPAEEDVLVFLGEIAYAAAWENGSAAMQLPLEARHFRGASPSLEALAEALQTWLNEHPVQDVSASNGRLEPTRLLQLARNASLLEISPRGVLSFCHGLLAAYFIAEYFAAAGMQFIASLSEGGDLAPQFIVPIALWAGLLDDPVEFAERFVEYGRVNTSYALDALMLSLVCLGVACAPPQAEQARQVRLPPALEKVVTLAVRDGEARRSLARVFTRYAEEGAQELYQALFPLLMVDGIDEFMILLDTEVVSRLFFQRLCEVVDNAAYEMLVKRLVRVLGRFGAAAVPLARELSHPVSGRSGRLRSAAINILGGTGEQSAVDPLIACLSDANQFIVDRSANALIRLGPALTLSRLLQELEELAPTANRKQVHAVILRILERFLEETSPGRQLTASQHQQVMNALLRVLTLNYAPENQQQARELVVHEGRTAEESASGEKAIDFLAHNLAAPDEATARSAIKALIEIGTPATPGLLRQLNQQPSEITCMRIVEVLGRVRDARSLPYLMRLLADPALAVQQQVTQALLAFAPESVPGLIEQVLHSDSDMAAARAEQILGDVGKAVVEPVIHALSPVEPGRTHMLVHVLGRVHHPQAIPALIALLESASRPSGERPQLEQPLVVALIHALGQFPDERVVAPLMDMLTSANPLFYEEAINALSSLEDAALEQLVAALDVEGETVLTSRVERAVLGMLHFPGERLLDVFARGSDAQAQHVIDIFLAKGAQAAYLLVRHLFHPDRRVQMYGRQALGQMPGQFIVPALLDNLDHPEPAWRAVIAEFLLKYPQEAIPPLVSLLDENERGQAAQIILLEFGPQVLPFLVAGLDSLNNLAQERTRQIILELVRQAPELITRVVQLFNLSPPPPQRAHEALIGLLTNELVDVSVPVLLEGLEDAHLVGAVSEALVSLVNKGDARGEMVLHELLAALRNDQRRHGAEITLIDIGAKAVPGVGNLITDPDPAVAEAAQHIMCEMGVPAFAFIWAAHSDTSNPARREAARSIFRRMHTVVIKDELVQLLSSEEPDHISMALALLLERIHDEALQPGREHEMIPALLEHVQTHSDERASQRIMALLLLLGGHTVIDMLTQVLYDFPNHQERFLYAFLLLGEEAEEVLLEVLHDPDAPPLLQAEAAAMLGILAPHVDIREYARMLAEYGLWAGQSMGMAGVLQPERLSVSLRALGGLLAGGHWNPSELQYLRLQSREDSAERELYEMLLGWRYGPQIAELERDLEVERQEHKKNVLKLTQEVMAAHMQIEDLEHQLEQLHHEHGLRGEELEQVKQEIQELRHSLDRTRQEKQRIQDNLQRALQDKQALKSDLQQANQERDKLQEQVEEWRERSEELEQELRDLRSSRRK